MNVYAVAGDQDCICARAASESDYLPLLRWRKGGRDIARQFIPEIELYFFDEIEGFASDFPDFSPGDLLLLSDTARDAFGELLEGAGAVVRTRPKTLTEHAVPMHYHLLLCSRVLEDVMRPHPTLVSEFGRPISSYYFDKQTIGGSIIFCVKGSSLLFVTDRFVDVLERHRLSGLRVVPVWSEEQGPIDPPEGGFERFPRLPPGFTALDEKREALREFVHGRRERQPGWR